MALSKTRSGLMFGALLSGFHLCWLILVAAGVAKKLLDWVLSLHFMSYTYSMLPFNYLDALTLLVLTFVVGYVFGYIVAAILNAVKE